METEQKQQKESEEQKKETQDIENREIEEKTGGKGREGGRSIQIKSKATEERDKGTKEKLEIEEKGWAKTTGSTT